MHYGVLEQDYYNNARETGPKSTTCAKVDRSFLLLERFVKD
jgi:hypothetical protein